MTTQMVTFRANSTGARKEAEAVRGALVHPHATSFSLQRGESRPADTAAVPRPGLSGAEPR